MGRHQFFFFGNRLEQQQQGKKGEGHLSRRRMSASRRFGGSTRADPPCASPPPCLPLSCSSILCTYRVFVPSFFSKFFGFFFRRGQSPRGHRWPPFFYWQPSPTLQIWVVLLGFTGFYRILPSFTGCWLVILGLTGFDWVWLGLTGFYWVLLGFTGFNWVTKSSTKFQSEFLIEMKWVFKTIPMAEFDKDCLIKFHYVHSYTWDGDRVVLTGGLT